ncbi:MAG: hypothetical protein ACTSR2_00985 [Candidatus Hodarchaeales archaeon]
MVNISDSFATQIDEWISAVSAWIDNFTGTTFETESDSYKLYDGDGTRELMIDDLVSLTKIEILDEDGNVDETIDSSDEYYLYPANETPKYRIVLNTSNAPIAVFPKGHQNIKVYGDFGYSSSVPEDVRLAATMLVSQIIKDGNLDITGNIKSERLGEYSVTFQDIDKIADRIGVKEILNHYKIMHV